MPKVRNVIKHLSIEKAAGKRKCHTNSAHTIAIGERHLAQVVQSGQRENICKECAGKVFDEAEAHLAALRKDLGV